MKRHYKIQWAKTGETVQLREATLFFFNISNGTAQHFKWHEWQMICFYIIFPLLDHCVYYLTYPYIFFSSYRSFTFNEQLCSLQIEKYCIFSVKPTC